MSLPSPANWLLGIGLIIVPSACVSTWMLVHESRRPVLERCRCTCLAALVLLALGLALGLVFIFRASML